MHPSGLVQSSARRRNCEDKPFKHLRTLFTFETADIIFNRKQSNESLNDYASFDEPFYDNFFSGKA